MQSPEKLKGNLERERNCSGMNGVKCVKHKNMAIFSFFTTLSAAEVHGFGVKYIELHGTVDFIAIRHFSL